MSARETLVRAKALLEEKGWTKGAFARRKLDWDKNPWPCVADDPKAEAYSADGAIIAAAWPDAPAWREAIDVFAASIGREGGNWASVRVWNDSPDRTAAGVIAQFDLAIKQAPQ